MSASIQPEVTALTPALVSLPVSSLVANDYNPNEMTTAQMEELVAEVRHLGRLPKPVIVRSDGSGRCVIVDGEHGWRAAMTLGFTEVACEVVDVDDFEARRQTFKRNQHGTHHPVRLGQMFAQMMAARNLSQRALAREIEISEGTVRNALSYADAAESLRNRYADGHAGADGLRSLTPATIEQHIGALTVRQVRTYLEMPEGLRHRWLAGGADADAASGWQYIEPSLYAWWPSYTDFRTAFKRIRAWSTWESHWCIGDLTHEALRPYTQHFFKNAWVVRSADLMDDALETIIETSSGPPRFLLTPDEFEIVLSNGGVHGDNHCAFLQRLEGAIAFKGFTVPPMRNYRLKEQLRAQEIATSAPDYIRNSALSVREKYAVWKRATPDWLDETAAEQTRRQLARKSSLHATDDEDADAIVFRAFRAAHARVRIKDIYRKLSHRELAAHVARWVPLYDAKQPLDALMIGVLTDKLETLTRGELICFTQMAEEWEWDATITAMLRAVSAVGDVIDAPDPSLAKMNEAAELLKDVVDDMRRPADESESQPAEVS